MKKNMLAVLILVVLVVNLTLTAYMIFTVVPNAKRTDQLITKILQIIDLELESPLPEGTNISWSIEDAVKLKLDEATTNLTIGADGKAHYAVINASITMNSKDEDYKKYELKVDEMKTDIRSYFIAETAKCTYEDLLTEEGKKAVKEAVLRDIQTLFNSKFVVDVTLDFLFQ